MGFFERFTPQKSNELIPKIAMFKGSYLLQTIILGIQPLVFSGVQDMDVVWIYLPPRMPVTNDGFGWD